MCFKHILLNLDKGNKMNKKQIVVALAMALSMSFANAGNNNDGVTCNGNGSCATNSTTNNNTTNQGGVGYGGDSSATGGNAMAGSASNATGGSVNHSGNSSNLNANNVKNDINNKNTSNNTNLNGQLQGQEQSTENANNSTNSVNIQDSRNPVSTAFAPSIAPTANCSLSISGGVQVMGFGGSFGKAYIDENCAALEQVRNVALVLKDTATAEALLCQNEKYAKARATAGRACPVEQE